MLTFNENGDRLLGLHPTSDEEDVERLGPLTHAVVLVRVSDRGQDGVLLVHNRTRNCWELPGGLREPGESAVGCAERELREETGLSGLRLRLCALMVLDLQPSRHHRTRHQECGAIFRTDRPRAPRPFRSEEITALAVHPVGELPAGTGPLDAHLIQMFWNSRNDPGPPR